MAAKHPQEREHNNKTYVRLEEHHGGKASTGQHDHNVKASTGEESR
jgi:hypothetical protein